MAKIFLIPKKKKSLNYSMLITVSIIFALSVVSSYLVKTLIVEYRQQLAEFEKLKQSYDEYLQAQDEARKLPTTGSISIDLFDQVMAAKPQHLIFDRMKVAKNSPLQVEGVTIKPLEIDEFLRQAESSGLKLQINQVQKDSDQQVRFDLRQDS